MLLNLIIQVHLTLVIARCALFVCGPCLTSGKQEYLVRAYHVPRYIVDDRWVVVDFRWKVKSLVGWESGHSRRGVSTVGGARIWVTVPVG